MKTTTVIATDGAADNADATKKTSQPAAPRTAPPLPPAVLNLIAEMREELVKVKLGGVGRRVQMGIETIHEGISMFGREVLVTSFGGQRITTPVEVTATLTLHVKVGTAVKTYEVAVGANPTAPEVRPEAPLTGFPEKGSGPQDG